MNMKQVGEMYMIVFNVYTEIFKIKNVNKLLLIISAFENVTLNSYYLNIFISFIAHIC